jgi:hypothetical protein
LQHKNRICALEALKTFEALGNLGRPPQFSMSLEVSKDARECGLMMILFE